MRNWFLLLSCCFTMFFHFGNFSVVKPFIGAMGKSHFSTGLLVQRTVSITQRSCSCQTPFSCSCCQSVTILLRRVANNFCVNFNYTQTGLSMDILLGSNTIRHVSIIDYRVFKVCTLIPDCPNSYACIDVVELSLFPRSITICIQIDITSKNENWLINYNCISVSTNLSNQNQTGMAGVAGQPGQMPAGQIPAGQTPAGQTPAGQTPAGQMPAGQMPAGQIPAGQMPAGQMPAGQMPAGQMLPGQMPAGQMPAGQMPAAQMPAGQMLPGQMPAGRMPPGQMPPGQIPTGQIPTGQIPTGQTPTGQMPPRQMQVAISGGGWQAIFKSTRRVSGFLNWASSGKTRESAVGIMKNRSNTREIKSAFRNNLAINISAAMNEISKDILEKEGRELEDGKVQNEDFSTRLKIEFRDNFDTGKLNSNNNFPTKVNQPRTRRSIDEKINEINNSAMKMQVILRSRKTRLPKMASSEGMMKNTKISRLVNHLGSRNARIVNGDTISIPMSGSPGSGNVLIMNTTTLNNAFTPTGDGSEIELATPQEIPSSPSNRFPGPPPVLVLEGFPPIERPAIITNNFPINYDNRTSSFPNRMPPSFGIASRTGPIDENKSIQFFERSIEELETVGPEIQPLPNSKFIEMISTSDFSDDRIIFPE